MEKTEHFRILGYAFEILDMKNKNYALKYEIMKLCI